MWFWPDTVMSLLPVPPASIMPSLNIVMCLSLSLTLPETARRLSSNLCDEEDFNAVIHHLPFFFHLSVSVYCTQSSCRLCHPATSPVSSLLSLLSISLSHLICTQSKHKTIWKIKCRLALPSSFSVSPPSSPTCLLARPEGIVGFRVTGEVGD